MADPAEPVLPMTVADFVAWTEQRSEDGRYELHDGHPVRMQAERVRHLRVKARAHAALAAALASRGLTTCEALPDGATVRVDDSTAFQPDALVVCGPPLEDDAVVVPTPVIVVEVVSPSNRTSDLSRKLSGYLSLPGLHHFLILEPERRCVIHHRRESAPGEPVRALTQILTRGTLTLDPPGLTLAVADLFPPVPEEPVPCK